MERGRCGLRVRNWHAGRAEDEDSYAWYKYEGLVVRDLRRSVDRILVNAGVPRASRDENLRPQNAGGLRKDHIVCTDDGTNAMRRLEWNGNGESLLKAAAPTLAGNV